MRASASKPEGFEDTATVSAVASAETTPETEVPVKLPEEKVALP